MLGRLSTIAPSFTKGDLDQNALESVGRQLRATRWQLQKDAGIDLLPVQGLHIDAVCAPDQLLHVLDRLPIYKILSVGLVNGRNV